MRVLGIIPARSGSKGVPGKNLVPLMGKPLLAYTAEAAAKSSLLTRTVLSTDDERIAAVGRKFGVEVPFLRPSALAGDLVPTIAVLRHVVSKLENAGESYDAIFTLQPTNPLRRADDIDGAIRMMEETGADSVISFVDAGGKHPARMKKIDEHLCVHDPPFAEEYEGEPRQLLSKYYLREGSVYLTRRNVLMLQRSLKGRDCRAWIIPPERAFNIDSPFDLFLAEQALLYQQPPCQTNSRSL